jgi:hypothetical protein
VGENVIIEFVDPNRNGEFRMTVDPSAKDALLNVPRETPRTNSATPKAGATVQPMIPGGVLISVPLTAYGDHKVSVYARIARKEVDPSAGKIQGFEQFIQGPAPLFTKIVALTKGSYQIEVVVKDTATNKIAADTIEFEVK